MKKLTNTLFPLMLILFTIMLSASCKKDKNTDLTDGDEKGSFVINFDDKVFSGDAVINGAAMGLRTMNVEATGFSLSFLYSEENFVAGTDIDLGAEGGGVITIALDEDGNGEEDVYFGLQGHIKVISKSKIEIDADFYNGLMIMGDPCKVTGTIDAK